jgi:1-deoxy-D-xylulose-5-phosphate synthase
MADAPRILDTITGPADLRRLDEQQLALLAAEIREELIGTVSETGGHLAPNLGVVELTIGLHRALDCPTDRIVWDVGHQSYVHKLLTGRTPSFGTLRQYGGLCGFPKRSESCYDAFDTGHASNSISVALGMAAARDIMGGDETVVAVIGDGSLTGGMAFEALNHAGHLDTDLIVLLNDNEMSIARNVGGLSRYLARARLDPRYNRLRDDIENALARIPGVGSAMVAAGEAAKESVKQLLVPGMLFEELGFKYVGPIDGHDAAAVEEAIRMARAVDGPVLVHAVTRKGFGYRPAEASPDEFHGVAPFEIATGKVNGSKGGPPAYTAVFGEAIMREAERDSRVVAITAAMPAGTGLARFCEAHPDRCFDVGIAEQHAVGLAAGLATRGLVPVVAIYSTFMQRAYDQLIEDVALQGLHVVFMLDRAGVVGEDGPTHHGVFDLTYLRSVPDLHVLAPSDEAQLVEMFHWALNHDGPVAIRYPRGAGEGVPIPDPPLGIDPVKAVVVEQGSEVALLAVGRMVGVARKAAALLAQDGISATVVDMRWVKPLDSDAVQTAARGHRLLVTVEESTGAGGFGAAVMEALSDAGIEAPILRVAVPDCFVTHGSVGRLLEEIGLTPEGLRGAVRGRLLALPDAASGQEATADGADQSRSGARR